MSDLTDALDNWERIGVKGPIYEAARRVADAPEWLQRLLEDPPSEPDEIWWCQKHDQPGMECDENEMGQRACEMVRRPLLKPEGHE